MAKQQKRDISPPPGTVRPRADKGPTEEGGWGFRRRARSRWRAGKGKGAETKRVQKISPWGSGGWEEPGRSQVAIQRPARMAAHGGVDGGRSHDAEGTDNTRGPTDGDLAAGGGDPGVTEQTESQGDVEDPEGLGGAEGSGDWGGGRDPEDRGGAGATEDEGGAEGKEEPDRAGGMEWRGEARGAESQGGGWSTTDQGGAPEGRGSPVELVGWRAMVETRELWAKVEPMVRRTEMESRARRLEVEIGDPHALAELEAGSPEAMDQSAQLAQTEGELRGWQAPARLGLRNWLVQEEAGEGGWEGRRRFRAGRNQRRYRRLRSTG